MKAHERVVLEESVRDPHPRRRSGAVRMNGFPGQIITEKKKIAMIASVAPAHGMSAACRSR